MRTMRSWNAPVVAVLISLLMLVSGATTASAGEDPDGGSIAHPRLQVVPSDAAKAALQKRGAELNVDNRCDPNGRPFRLRNGYTGHYLGVDANHILWCWSPNYEARLKLYGTSLCLDSGGKGSVGVNPCNDGDYQGWDWVGQNLRNVQTRYCLEEVYDKPVWTWDCAYWAEWQHWYAEVV